MTRYVSLPAISRRVPLGAYVKAIRQAKANPDVEFKHGLTTWWPTTGREIVEQFRRGMVERINEAKPYSLRGAL
jgi:hypothetical protein